MRATPPRGVIDQTNSSRVPYGLGAIEGRAYSGTDIPGTSAGMLDPYYPIPDPLLAGEGFSSVWPSHNEAVQHRRTYYNQDHHQDFHIIADRPSWTLAGPLRPRAGRKLLFARRREFLTNAQTFSGLHGSPVLNRPRRFAMGNVPPARRDRLVVRARPRSYGSTTRVVGRER